MTESPKTPAWRAICIFAALSVGHLSPASEYQSNVPGPRLAALLEVPAEQRTRAVNAFWREIKVNGTPLMESIPGGDSSVFFTFLWRATPGQEAANVSVSSSFLIPAGEVKERLVRLGETDIWYRTYRLPADSRFSYYLVAPMGFRPAPDASWRISYENDTVYEFFPDPLGRKSYERMDGEAPDSGEERWVTISYAEGPKAPREFYLEAVADEQRGTLVESELHSEILGNHRRISVYLPADYPGTGASYPFLVLFDREQYVSSINTPLILDNLVAQGLLPPMVGILVGNAGPETRGEELPPNEPFQEFLATELIPWLRGEYRLASDPACAAVAGSSLGGIAAAYSAYSHPEIFGNVISQSGSYWWPSDGDGEDETTGWLTTQFAETPKRNIRVYQDVGQWEGDGMILPNRKFRDALRAAGYPVVYREFVGGHDYLNWRSTLVDALLVLFGTEKAERYLDPSLNRLPPG